MNDEQAQFARARALYRAGKLSESEDLFRQLVDSRLHGAGARAGLGMIRLRLGDTAASAALFKDALQHSEDADAHYGLGVLAQQGRAYPEAIAHFLDAIAINPHHEAAQRAYATLEPALSPSPERPPGHPAPQEPHPVAGEPDVPPAHEATSIVTPEAAEDVSGFDIFDQLKSDKDPRARAAVKSIESLRFKKRRPFLSAYLGSFIIWTPFWFLLGFGMALAVGASGGALVFHAIPAELGVKLFVFGLPVFGLVYGAIRVKSTIVTIDRGIIQIQEGVFVRRSRIYEIYRFVSFETEQDMFNRLTGDGALVMRLPGVAKVVVKGICKHDELIRVALALRSLHLQLRSVPWLGKGIMS